MLLSEPLATDSDIETERRDRKKWGRETETKTVKQREHTQKH